MTTAHASQSDCQENETSGQIFRFGVVRGVRWRVERSRPRKLNYAVI